MKKRLIMFFIFLMSLNLFSINIEHNRLNMINLFETKKVRLQISSTENIQDVNFYYKTNMSTMYTKYEMEEINPSSLYEYELYFENEQILQVNYYFEIKTTENTYTYPMNNPKINPIRANIIPISEKDNNFVLLTPDSHSEVQGSEITIAISYFHIQDIIDKESIRFLINGKDYTEKGTVTNNLFLINNLKLPADNYSYSIKAKTKNNKPIRSKNWQIKTFGEGDLLHKLKHTGYAKTTYEIDEQTADDFSAVSDDSSKEFKFELYDKLRLNSLSLISKLSLSSEETSNQQSINRYSFNFNMPFLKIWLGDYEAYYSKFTLNNSNSRGAHFNFYTNYFRFKSSFGSSMRSVEKEAFTSKNAFEREQLGVRMEVGPKNSFYWGLNAAKSKDKKNSIASVYYKSDSLYYQEPKDNFVLSTDFNLNLFSSRIQFNTEIATSFYNSNIEDGVLTKEELEDSLGLDIPFDPEDFESIIVINKNLEPIKPSIANTAIYSNLQTFFKNNLLNLSYSRIGTAFESLSTYSLLKDTQEISINDNLSLLNNQLFLSGGLSYIQNNLSDDRLTTEDNINFYFQTIINNRNYPRLIMNFQNSSMKNNEDSETESIDYQTNQYTISINEDFFEFSNIPSNFDLSFTTMTSENESLSYEDKQHLISISTINHFKNFPFKTRFNYNLSLNESEMDYNTNSFSLRTDFNFLENMLRPYLKYYFSNSNGDIETTSVNSLLTGVKWYIKENISLNCDLNYSTYSIDAAESDYSKFDSLISLRYDF